jgi:DUF4097 and DUF4098 domain-containing protein YvlB
MNSVSATCRATLSCLSVLLALSAPALAATRIEKTFNLQPGGRLRLETGMGRVRVTGKPGPGAHMVVTSQGRDLDELLNFRYEEGPQSVTVVARSRHHVFFSHDSVEFELEVPAETSIDIDTSGGAITASALKAPAKLETSGGGITVTDLAADLDAHTSGGPIRLRDIQGRSRVETSGGGIEAVNVQGPLRGETSGGSIHLENVSGDAEVHTSGGGITIRNAGGRVAAETSGGSIDATFARGNAHGGSLESSGGGITVALDPNVGLVIDAEGNHVRSDLPLRVQGEISRHSLRGTLGNGGEKLYLHTSGGGVRIQGL